MSSCDVCNYPNRPNARFCANCRAPLVLQTKYHITGLLGRGGYGAVYRAEHTGLGGAVYAIKELNPDPTATSAQQQAASDQFRLEASLLAKLKHAALPQVMDFFTEGGRDYLVMEFVEGATLEELLERNRAPFDQARVLAWADELCDVLTYLRTRQPAPVIHRDVKPSNVKLTPDGKLVLIDFGIAKLMISGAGTASAARAISPPYSPMEQYGKGTDSRSDIYALGVTLYQLLTNCLPPEAPDRNSEDAIPLRKINPAISEHIETVVLKAMAVKPLERFQSTAEMKQALHSTVAEPETLGSAPPQPSTRHYSAPVQTQSVVSSEGCFGVMAAMALGVLVLILIAGGVSSLQENLAQQASATAQAAAVFTGKANAAATGQAEATTTARANATDSTQARATATVQGVLATATALAANATQVYGSANGSLTHTTDNIHIVYASASTLELSDSILQATFYNPFNSAERSWDYGLVFRNKGWQIQQYRLILRSDRTWQFRLFEGNADSGLLDYGSLSNFDTSSNGSNQVRLIVRGGGAYLFVNGQYVTTLDVSKTVEKGTISVATGLYFGDQITGRSTRYEGFTVWSLP